MPSNTQQDDLDLGATLRGFSAGQTVFGRYRLDRILGRGGMGVVWLAHDEEMGEEIALKFLPEVVRLDASGLDELKAETRKSRKLTHRNIVRVHDFVSDAHSAGIAMEWVDGSTLSAMRLTRPGMVFEPDDLKAWIKQVCEALEYAHFVAKLIHRDLKPANIMLNAEGEVKVADFGISSSLTESASRVSVRRSASGTLAYMSPQQALGQRPKVADDVYSLGATIYELISGKPPFFRGDLYAQVRDVVPPSMAERREESEIPAGVIPDEWEKTIAACLEKDPAMRPQSAMEVAFRLGLVSEYEPRTAEPEPPKTGIVRVQKEEPKPAPAKAASRLNPLIPAGAVLLILLAIVAAHFMGSHPAPVAQAASPTPAPSARPAPAASAPAAIAVAPAPVPVASPVAQASVPVVPQAPAPTAAPAPSVAPVMPATPLSPPAPIVPVAATVDPQLVGSWQSGSYHATRKQWVLESNGQYIISVGGAITDSGTMSTMAGHIVQISRNSAQPYDVTYTFDDGVLNTQGNGVFDDTNWHKGSIASSADSSSSSSSSSSRTYHHTGNSDSDSDSEDNNGGAKQEILNSFRQRYGF